ncbi:MAG: hypothetical protein GF355_04000 [Candidatus Eisenbacteria bacterium]|nr:hypothetical protein [Candidatus Eisenbacteria bacterium]
MPPKRSPQALVDLLRKRPAVDLATICSTLGEVSPMTAFRYLRQVPYRRSYNQNGRFYSHHDPSRYDRFGLWSWEDIHFSIDGSLKNTVRRLVHEAEAGVTQRELQERLRVRVYNTLLHLLRKREIDRDRLAKVYLYLHCDARVRSSQLERRQELFARAVESDETEISSAAIIQVLLTLIRHPGLKPGEIARRLRGHSPPVTRHQVEAIFTRYELGEKGGYSRP